MGAVALFRIKSNLVGDDEQGVLMGAVSSIGKASATVGLVFFGWLFHTTTRGGASMSSSSMALSFSVDACIILMALLVACATKMEYPQSPKEASAVPATEEASRPTIAMDV